MMMIAGFLCSRQGLGLMPDSSIDDNGLYRPEVNCS